MLKWKDYIGTKSLLCRLGRLIKQPQNTWKLSISEVKVYTNTYKYDYNNITQPFVQYHIYISRHMK